MNGTECYSFSICKKPENSPFEALNIWTSGNVCITLRMLWNRSVVSIFCQFSGYCFITTIANAGCVVFGLIYFWCRFICLRCFEDDCGLLSGVLIVVQGWNCGHGRPSKVIMYVQVQGGTRPTTEGSRENIGHNVHVWGDRERNTRL